MNKPQIVIIFLLSALLLFGACNKKGCTNPDAINFSADAKKEDGSCILPEEGPALVFKFKFDSTQIRLNNFGQPATLPNGHAAQSPIFQKISAHYVELSPSMLTQLGNGEVVYFGPETTLGGASAVDFNQALLVGQDEVFLRIPIKNIQPGTYEWLRVSLTYQNYDIKYRASGFDLIGRIASFVAFNTYINEYQINTQTVNVNANKLQGFWGFESMDQVFSGQAPATTVPNPLSATSPVPQGSCVVTGQFANNFTINGNETSDVVITISLSTNNSFEWQDLNGNGIYEPLDGENVVDMGLRGLIPIVD